jgi:hypothetical protein
MNKDRENVIKLFEIGICDQRFPYASTKLWLSYFKNIDLYCADNFWGHYLEDKIKDINNNFELIEMVLDKHKINYLAVFRKK